MISSIRGQIIETGNRYIVLDVGNIGYKVSVTDDALHTLKIGSEVMLWTHFAVREDSQTLYGFLSKKERDFFELLITVSGIGPKSALNILSMVASEALANAIRNGSTAHLTKVSGIGRKTAEKIVMELKDKLGIVADAEMASEMSSDMDALEALKALGYDTNEARDALKKVSKDIGDTGAKVKAALKMIGK